MKHLTREAFTFKYYPFVKNITTGTGLFPEIVIAQAIIESQGSLNGAMYPGLSKLAANFNNYFGIKAGSRWQGPTVNMNTGEVINNQHVTVKANFRVYNSAEDSFRDYVQFLKENPRYTTAGVFSAENYVQQAERINAAGYATNPEYGNMIAQVAERVKEYISKNSSGAGWNDIKIWATGLLLFFLTDKLLKP